MVYLTRMYQWFTVCEVLRPTRDGYRCCLRHKYTTTSAVVEVASGDRSCKVIGALVAVMKRRYASLATPFSTRRRTFLIRRPPSSPCGLLPTRRRPATAAPLVRNQQGVPAAALQGSRSCCSCHGCAQEAQAPANKLLMGAAECHSLYKCY